MASLDVRDAEGAVIGSRELPAEIFERPINVPLMHQVVVAGAAAQRAGTHSTKTRGEVRGGGVKPWRQKGTGRARQGSIRSPNWPGGGVAHGPKPRDHSVRINKKMKRSALRSALSDTAISGKLALVDAIAFDEPKTKSAAALLEALELTGRVLLVIGAPNEAVEKSFRNLTFVKIVYPGSLSTYDLVAADRVLFTTAAFDALVEGKRTFAETTEPSQERPPEDAPGLAEPDAAPAEEGPAETPDEPEPAPEPDTTGEEGQP